MKETRLKDHKASRTHTVLCLGVDIDAELTFSTHMKGFQLAAIILLDLTLYNMHNNVSSSPKFVLAPVA